MLDLSRMGRRLFEDRTTGRIVIGQWPNLALWTFLAALLLGALLPKGQPKTIAHVVEVTALAVWAADEIARGVNPWRRFLGVGVLICLVVEIALA